MNTASLVARITLVGALAAGLCTGPAWGADAQQSAMAEQLFREGRELVQAGRVQPALDKFEASQQLDPSLGTLLNLADCLEKLGRSASAWARFSEAEQTARLEKDRIRERAAAEHARALEPKLIRLRIVVGPQVSPGELSIELDGKPLAMALLGTAMPVDPGEHRVVARSAGKRDWSSSVQLTTPGETAVMTVSELFPEPGSVATAPATTAESKTAPLPVPETREAPASSTAPTIAAAPAASSSWARPGWVTVTCGAASVVALGLGTGYGIAAWSAWSDAKSAGCSDGRCPTASAQSRSESAGSRADIATVGFVSAGVLAGATVVSYLLLDRPSGPAPKQGQVVLNAIWTPSQVSASLGMAF